MRSFSFIIALLFALVSSTYAWPELHILEARKGGRNGTASIKNNNGTSSIRSQCKQMAKLTKLAELASNSTTLDAKLANGKIDQAQVDAIKAKATEATTKLATMTSNTTLVSECLVVDAHQKVVSQCRQISKLTKLASLANNATAKSDLIANKKLNDTQVTKFDERIASAATKLAEMTSNTTLTALCTVENQQRSTSNGGSTTGSESATAGKTTSGAMALSAQTLPYVLVPILAVFFGFL